MNKIGILYATVDGQTLKIARSIADSLEEKGCLPELYSIDDFKKPVSDYQTLVIGSSIRYGKHQKHFLDFVEENAFELNSIKTAFFSVNLVARKSNKNAPETNPYVRKFLSKTSWRPNLIRVFAGKLDYKKYSFPDRLAIQLIMLITKGPLNPKAEIEYTDWRKVKEFTEAVADLAVLSEELKSHA